MREILFRGKRIDNGEWITGQLLRYEDGRARIIESKTDCFCYEKDESIIQTVAHAVNPETVGQFTGLTDKNGKKVFEGDILEERYFLNTKTILRKVMFYDGAFSFNDNNHEEPIAFADYEFGIGVDRLFIIGNVFDNPELLEDKA